MGKREGERFAVWKEFSLFLRFSQEIMIGTGEALSCRNHLTTPPDLHARRAASGNFLAARLYVGRAIPPSWGSVGCPTTVGTMIVKLAGEPRAECG
jgi:hypothetical protein